MKKTRFFCILCLSLLFITACHNPSSTVTGKAFANGDEMLAHLEGMWVVEDNNDSNLFYVFQDGQVYIILDQLYSDAVKNALDTASQSGGLKALSAQSFAVVTKRLYLEDISIVCDEIAVTPSKGLIKLFPGESNEMQIVITENSVLLQSSNCSMTKISDTADFSTEYFEQLFNQVIDSYQIPARYILMSPEEYGEMVKSIIPNFDSLLWKENRSGENSVVYQTIPEHSIDGSLFISNQEVNFKYIIEVDNWYFNEATSDLERMYPTLKIYYTPENSSISAEESGKTSINIASLIQYCLYAVKDYPGAYTDPVTLYNDMVEKGETTQSASDTLTTMKANGLAYQLSIDKTGTSATFNIQIEDTISYKDIIKDTSTESETSPTQGGTLTQLLDGSKSWVGKWNYEGWEYNVYFVFKEDGTCYFALGDTYLFGAGKGTYTVKGGNTISINLMVYGKKYTDTYTFNSNNFSLEVVSTGSFAATKGEVLYLQEDTVNGAQQIEDWGNSYYNRAPAGDGDWE